MVQAQQECRVTRGNFDLAGQTFTVSAPWGKLRLRMPLLGRHQLENAATALAGLHALQEQGVVVSRAALTRGFRSVNWPGRLEVLRRSPLVVADGAHNPYSAGKLREALRDYFPFKRLVYVVGCSADKNIAGIIQELAVGADLVVATRSRHPRAV